MESPILAYQRLSGIDNIKTVAYDVLFRKYIINGDRGENKMWEIDSTDQESLLLQKNGGFPLPGNVYIFQYSKDDPQFLDGKEYFDMVPLIFCTTVKKWGSVIEGINFNMLPLLERVKFFEAYYRLYNKFFSNLEEKTENNELALNKKYISWASSPIGGQIIKLFAKLAGANFNYAYRKYKWGKIDNLRLVEYVEWDYIPHFEPKDAFNGLNQKDIQSKYWRSKK